MTQATILIIRLLLGAFFGVLLARIFYPDASPRFIIGLVAILVGLSYLTAYLRRRKKRD